MILKVCVHFVLVLQLGRRRWVRPVWLAAFSRGRHSGSGRPEDVSAPTQPVRDRATTSDCSQSMPF